MIGESKLEKEAALRRALTNSSRHAGASIAHYRSEERIDAVARIAAAGPAKEHRS